MNKKILDLYRDAINSGLTIEDVHQQLKEFDEMVQQVQTVKQKDRRLSTRFWRLKRIAPIALITVGSILIANAAWPILFYTFFVSPSLKGSSLQAPIPQENMIAATNRGDGVAMAKAVETNKELVQPKPKPVIINEQLDYTNLANWFTEGKVVATDVVQEAHEYIIDIPSLGIEKAEVKVGGTDLNHSLIQYPNTAEPGEFGAPVIFGHSVLRQFYRPQLTNPNRYKSIFSKIMTLKEEDQIFITYDGIKYTYIVEEKHEVNPEDTFILEQRHSSRELKLITCVPEGTYLHRGVVVARLEKME